MFSNDVPYVADQKDDCKIHEDNYKNYDDE